MIYFKNCFIKMSLRTQRRIKYLIKKLRMHCSEYDSRGSAVVEAAVVVPIFLCALCTLLAAGQMLLAREQIKYAVTEAAGIYAQSRDSREDSGLFKQAELYGTFQSFLDADSLSLHCIVGGKSGIILTGKHLGQSVQVEAAYVLRTPVPYFKGWTIPVRCRIQRRFFSGYVEHAGEEAAEDPVVYITEHGRVYHTSMTCTHICLKISRQSEIQNVLTGTSYTPCKKCIKKGKTYTTLYVTARGNACHSTLTCSGLKRTIRAVPLSEAGGMKKCTRCAGGS